MNTTEPFRPEERQTAEAPLLTGSQALIESFLREGVETLFGYPGGAIIPVYDALYDYRDRLRHILVRHEQGAVHAAQGYARVSGRVGVCLVTSGPGATNTVTGLADALMDSTPLVLVTGQVGSTLLGTDAFQETNFVGITQAVTKWNCQVKRTEDIPAAIAKAFYIARSGRPGPLVVDITKDAPCATAPFRYERITSIRSYAPALTPDARRIEEAARLIDEARRPLAMIGQGAILGNAEAELRAFLDRSGLPAASRLLGLSALPSVDPRNVGMLGMHGNYGPNLKNRECALLVAVGMRFDDRVRATPPPSAPPPGSSNWRSTPPKSTRSSMPPCPSWATSSARSRCCPHASARATTAHGSRSSAPATASSTSVWCGGRSVPTEGASAWARRSTPWHAPTTATL